YCINLAVPVIRYFWYKTGKLKTEFYIMRKFHLILMLLFVPLAIMFTACDDGEDGLDGIDGKDGIDGEDGKDGEDLTEQPTMFENKSGTKPLVAMSGQFNFVEAYSLISTPDVIGEDFQLAGSADGAGFLKDGDGYIYVVNCEDSY